MNIKLQLVSSGKPFLEEGEARLSEWMEANAFVVWVAHEKPWDLEEQLIQSLSLPLNLDMNRNHAFYETLSRLRREAKLLARTGLIGG